MDPTLQLFAAQQGNVDIARILIANGADVNESAPDGIGGDSKTTRAFKLDTDAATLLVAIDSNHEAMARFLFDSGARPNDHGAGRTALHSAVHSAVQRAMPELVRALLARSADPNARLGSSLPLLSRSSGSRSDSTSTRSVQHRSGWRSERFGELGQETRQSVLQLDCGRRWPRPRGRLRPCPRDNRVPIQSDERVQHLVPNSYWPTRFSPLRIVARVVSRRGCGCSAL